MNELLEFVAGITILGFLLFPYAIVYRYRETIKKWLTDTNFCKSWKVDPVKKAKRGVVQAEWALEDAQDYLAFKESQQESQENERKS